MSHWFSFWEEIILLSQEKTVSISFKSQYIPSKYFCSLKREKCFSHNLFTSKSGKTHSTPYPVEIFQARSSSAIKMTTPLSISDFQTHTFCHISVPKEVISWPFVVEIITKNISAVYLFRISSILVSMSFFSSEERIFTWSITEESIGPKVFISNQNVFQKNIKKKATIHNFNSFFILFYLWYLVL